MNTLGKRTSIMLLFTLAMNLAQAKLPSLMEDTDYSKLPYEMVRIPAGEYVMGGEAGLSIERPPHTVALTYDFYMGIYEVDQLLFYRTSIVSIAPV